MSDSKKEIINQLLLVEAYADGLKKECCRTRKMLEGAEPPAPLRGMNQEVAAAISKSMARQKKQHVRKSIDHG
jgi:hypothetical protein